jgi:HAE1 family hydrophobic/amphiphilic exporter-1
MTVSELCVRRPVFTTMLITLPVVLGLFAYSKMGVDLFPNVDLPIVTVTTTRSGTSVEEMETGVTKRIEDVVNTISGIDELRSTTKEGISSVVITFVLEKNRDVAQQEVQGKINTILSQLPTGTDAPIIDKFDIDASPIMTIAISGLNPPADPKQLTAKQREITEITEHQIRDTLSSLPGVGSVNLVGGRKRAVQVTVDARKLEAYHLSIDQVRQALVNQNLELPGGRVDQDQREPILRTMGRVEQTRQFRDIIVSNASGQPIRVRDVGSVRDDVEEPRSLGRLDGNPSVLLVIQKQSGTNTVEVIDNVKRRLAQLGGIASPAPADYHGRTSFVLSIEGRGQLNAEVIRDQSRFINTSLHEVKKHLVMGAILVALTILLFLRDWRTMVIASLSIPVSLVSTLMVMNWLGFTLNNISMLALVLSVGIVIDDAVVVHENIFRWMEEKGYGAREASLRATREITLAVVATTLSLVVIFLPIAFMSGRVGRFFFSFGVTCAVAILCSMFVSFTLTPMLCSRFLKLSKKAREQGASHHSGGVYGRIVERPYLATLGWSLRHRWAIVLATIVVTMSIFPIRPLHYPGLFGLVGLDFLPKEDQSEFEIAITTPAGWTLARTDETFREIEAKLKTWPEVINVLTTIGDTSGRISKGQGDVTQGGIYIRLVDLNDRKGRIGRKFPQEEIMARARQVLADYPDLRSSVQLPAAVSAGTVNADVEMTLIGPDLAKLNEYADQMIATLRRNPGLADVDTTLALRKPEVRVNVDRDRASDLGVSIQSIAATLRTLVGGEVVSDFKDNQLGELYDVWLRAVGVDRDNRHAIENLTVPSTKKRETTSGNQSTATNANDDEMPRLIKLSNVATLGEARGPAQIDRFARTRKISIICNLAGSATSDAVVAFTRAAAELEEGRGLPAEYQLVPSGRAKTQAESNSAFLMAFGFSLIFMYMILAAQFESFVHPITILLAVPLTIPFAILSLIFLGQPLTIYSILGVFLLFGIVKKNGILQVDYTNILRHRAKEDPTEVPPQYRIETENGRAGESENAPHRFSDSPVHRFKASAWQRFLSKLSKEKRTRTWAIMEANRTRLRPILMTTLMLIAGMVPIALGEGPGSASRASMAKVIVGGQALSLLLTLLVTPVAYSLFDDLSLRRRRKAPEMQPQAKAEEAGGFPVEAVLHK